MERTHVSIDSLVDRVNHNEIKLPEIQRAYVWKPHQVAHLFDSLYRGYPSGAMLLWRPKQTVVERGMQVSDGGLHPVGTPAYLLDGQQRLTSLHRVYSEHPDASVVFNVETETFQIQSAATAKDPRWVKVAGILKAEKLGPIRKKILQATPGLDEDDVESRLGRVRAIAQYEYYLEILSGLPYDEVAQIFVRVNSGGRALKTVDLAMATLSAEWPGVVAKVEEEVSLRASTWPKIDTAFLVRALAATATETGSLSSLRGLQPEVLDAGWKRVRFGVDYVIKLLKENAGIETSNLIPSINALVPLVVLLGRHQEKQLDDPDALIYWLFGAFVTGRYSSAADTKIAQDSTAARSDDPIRGIYQSAGLLGSPLAVVSQQLIGKGAGSPFFLLSYLSAKGRGAKDWWYGVEISETGSGSSFAIEYHHIHPRTTLKELYTKAQINDLANLAFISAKANKKIGGRSPADYFAELHTEGKDELASHLVPLDPALRTAPNYLEFIAARRELLATEMTAILDHYRPAWVETEPAAQAPELERSVNLSILTEPATGPVLVFDAVRGQQHFSASTSLVDFERFLIDARDGLASTVEIGPLQASVEPEQEDVRVAVGPFELVGTVDEWQQVLVREKGDVTPNGLPAEDTPPHVGERQEFPVTDTE